jgi:hypothetical protein
VLHEFSTFFNTFLLLNVGQNFIKIYRQKLWFSFKKIFLALLFFLNTHNDNAF